MKSENWAKIYETLWICFLLGGIPPENWRQKLKVMTTFQFSFLKYIAQINSSNFYLPTLSTIIRLQRPIQPFAINFYISIQINFALQSFPIAIGNDDSRAFILLAKKEIALLTSMVKIISIRIFLKSIITF